MKTTVRLMLSLVLTGLIALVIVFFTLFGILPAENLTETLQGNSTSSEESTEAEFVYSTTTVVEETVVEKEIERKVQKNKSSDDESEKEEQKDSENKKDKSEDSQKQKQEQQEEQEPEKPTEQTLPPVVFNTAGKIKSVNSEEMSLTVASDGSHFELIPPSGVIEITVNLDSSTNILDSENNEVKFSALKKGQSISIESPSNIKNRKEFEASNIKLQN